MKYLSVPKICFLTVIIIFFACPELLGQYMFRSKLANLHPGIHSFQLQKDGVFFEPMVDKPGKKQWIYGIGTVAFAWTGYILKEKANHYHKLYERAGNRSDIKYYWDKMEMYDLMSNASYVISGVFSSLLIKELIFK